MWVLKGNSRGSCSLRGVFERGILERNYGGDAWVNSILIRIESIFTTKGALGVERM